MIRARSLRLVLALVLATAGIAAARPTVAAACGGYARIEYTADERAVLATVNNFFDAVARGKLRRALSDWRADAVVLFSNGGDDVVRSKPRAALRRWIEARDGMTYQTTAYAVSELGNTASVTVSVSWNGHAYVDELSLAKADGVWKITRKLATLVPDALGTTTTLTAGGGYY